MKLSIEVKIGLIAVAAIAVTYWGLNFLKGRNVLKSFDEYIAQYDDVSGLEINCVIYQSGYRIGQVNEIYFNKARPGKVMVMLGIRKGYRIPRNSVAELYSPGLMGAKAIRIILSGSSEYYKAGDTIVSHIKPGISDVLNQELMPVKYKAEELLTAMDSFMDNLNYIFDAQTSQNLKASIDHLENASREIDGMVRDNGRMNTIVADLESITTNIREHNQEIAMALENISGISDSLAKSELRSVISNTNEALKYSHSVLKKIDSGEGTVGMLANNDTLYRQLESASAQLDLLLKDIREHPRRYVHFSVFGGKKKE